eukprot:TRINITY_DN3017_c0_g1_i3.p1 TRINITY_DN3017_c0_g1~~TRINITY_DN3017_c0_g1_i3.p1  ORF type:complete len:214 (-),score=31.01 TRINITY_DN3017_c0_g1_i3:46-648(-)
MSNDRNDTYKILMVGDSNVGKSSIVLRYTDDTFSGEPITTIGSDFKLHIVKVEGKEIKLNIWDTAGQERFRTITSSYYRGARGVILVYDATNELSFHNARQWLTEIKRYASSTVVKLFVGNKIDLTSQIKVASATGKQFADEFDMRYIETSAKDGKNIDTIFTTLATDIYKQASSSPFVDDGLIIGFGDDAKPKSRRCAV